MKQDIKKEKTFRNYESKNVGKNAKEPRSFYLINLVFLRFFRIKIIDELPVVLLDLV